MKNYKTLLMVPCNFNGTVYIYIYIYTVLIL